MPLKQPSRKLAGLTAAACLSVSGTLWAWTGDSYVNTAVATATGDQLDQTAASDGGGGIIVAWRDQRADGGDIYAQRLDADGRTLWPVDGIALSTGDGTQEAPVVVGDGAGGAYIAWADVTGSDLYLQRVDADGAVAAGWPAAGLAITADAESDVDPAIIADGAGGVLVAWRRYGDVTNWDIYTQRIDADGAVHTGWPAGGIATSAADGGQGTPTLVGDGSGGAIVVWESWLGDTKTYAQRIDGDGNALWAANGIPLATSTDAQSYPVAVADGSGGAIVVWQDWRTAADYGDLYGQRVDGNGTLLWGGAGLAIAAHTGSYQNDHDLVSDGSGGAYIAWRDSRNAELWPASPSRTDIYLHRIDADGADAAGWPANGTRLTAAGARGIAPALANDGSGGVVATWVDNVYPTTELMAQRVSAAGATQWTAGGLTVSDQPGYAPETLPVADADGGAVIAWRNQPMGGDFDLFAQRVYSDGNLSSLATPVNSEPADGAYVGAQAVLTSSAFNDAATTPAGQREAQWRVLGFADPKADRAKAAATMDSMSDGALGHELPFTFPFYGRDIAAIAVNRNGLIELLEEGEACVECTDAGTHADGDHVGTMDAVFASNDSLSAADGYVKVYDGGNHVMVEWYGGTMADGGAREKSSARGVPLGGIPATNPVHFQVLLYADGRIGWNFRQMDFLAHDYDMYSGVYPDGGSEVDVGYAIDAQSSYTFDPATRAVATTAYAWTDPAGYVAYDSGETAIDLTDHQLPADTGLDDGDYYWAVRHKSDVGDWTPWSEATGFTLDTAGPNGAIAIDAGAATTDAAAVTLALSATDPAGITGYYVSESATTPTDDSGFTAVETTSAFATEVPFTLSGGDGEKTVYVWFRDAVGNIGAAASDGILLETPVDDGDGDGDLDGAESSGGGGAVDALLALLLAQGWQRRRRRRS